MSANQLLSKALSTESEDEAISCLKMARKKGLKLEEDITRGYYERKLKDHAQIVSVLEVDIRDKLRLNNSQRKEIHYLEDRLHSIRSRMYSLEAWLMVAAAAITMELIVIIILAYGG
jgi:hypothetical protein